MSALEGFEGDGEGDGRSENRKTFIQPFAPDSKHLRYLFTVGISASVRAWGMCV